MNWVAESLLSVGFFSATQILGKTNWRAGVPASVLNLATYIVVSFVFYVMVAKNVFDGISLEVLFLILFSAICIYIGNAASVRGFNYAPNPSYSTAVVKSYVVITLAASIFLFGGELSWKKIIGAIIILASQLLIVGRETREVTAGNHWAKYSFTSFFAYAALAIAVKYGTIFGANQLVFLFWAILGSLPLFAAETFFRKISILKFKKRFGPLFVMGIASGFGNLFFWNAFANAPNMGYVNAISITNVAIVCLLAVKLFGDELTGKKALGIAGVTAGLLVIILG